jgi:hypothetical protein
VIWEVTEGRGQFAGATGLITSNFTVGSKGEVVDNHYVRLFLPALTRCRMELVLNLTPAKALGLPIPQSVLGGRTR